MPARTRESNIWKAGLREQPREVWFRGERVKDVTTHPGLARGARAIRISARSAKPTAKYNAQMTYLATYWRQARDVVHHSPHQRRSRKPPRHDAQLGSFYLRNDGPLARDFMNVHFAAWAGAADYWGARQERSMATTCGAITGISPRTISSSPTSLLNLQRSRYTVIRHVQFGGRHRVTGDEGDLGRPRRARRAECWRHWVPSRMRSRSITPRLGRHVDGHSPFALNFSIPCGTPGLKFLLPGLVSITDRRISTIRSGHASRKWIASCSSTMWWCRGTAYSSMATSNA